MCSCRLDKRDVSVFAPGKMMLSGEWVEAEEALEIGLVREIVPQEKLMSRAREYAQKVSGLEVSVYLVHASGKVVVSV